MSIETLTVNRDSSLAVRHESMSGRDYLVVPMVMLTEGVHNGTNGPLYYPKEELAKAPHVWNMKPVVVYHPERNGAGASACDPDVLTKSGVGVILNTHFDGKLRAEAWLEKSRMDMVDNRIGTSIEKNEVMEVSTGVFTENELNDGVWNGEKYIAIARNYRPDHLALLPDKKGACSVADGAGLLQLNEDELSSFSDNLATELHQKGRILMAKQEKVDALIANKQTNFDKDDSEFLMTLEEDQLDKMVPKEPAAVVPPKKVEGGEPTPAGNEKKVDDAAATGGGDSNPAPAAAPQEPKTVSAEEYAANAPPEIRDMINTGLAAHNTEKTKLVKVITSNKMNTFSEDQLNEMGMQQLQSIAALAHQATPVVDPQNPFAPDYAGAAGAPAQNQESSQKPLSLPTMNFDDRKIV